MTANKGAGILKLEVNVNGTYIPNKCHRCQAGFAKEQTTACLLKDTHWIQANGWEGQSYANRNYVRSDYINSKQNK